MNKWISYILLGIIISKMSVEVKLIRRLGTNHNTSNQH